MLWVAFWGGKVPQGLLEWKGRQSQLLSCHLTYDNMTISLPSCNGLSVSASFIKTEVFTSPYKKICQTTQNHDFFPWTKKKKRVHKQNTTLKPERPRTAHSGVPWQEQTRLNWEAWRQTPSCIGFARKTPKFSGTVGRKQSFLNSLGGKWWFSITHTQNSPWDKGLP